VNQRPVYRSPIWDSTRWEGFRHRPGDIVICTPPKCGTTWTQMLCALLVFDGPDFPGTMDELSPWLDMTTRGKQEVHDLLGSLPNRRFIKTHTPLDGLPLDPGVTYLVVGRDPRDVAISFEHHFENLDFEKFLQAREAAVGNHDLADFPPIPAPIEDPAERMRAFVEGQALVTLDSVVHHLRDGWARRHEPNVALFHFADYQIDLPGEIVRLARVLGIDLDPDRAVALASEADLSRMRERAHEVAPDTTHNHWKDPKRFFRTGGRGEWRGRMSDADAARYRERVGELAPDPAFVNWLHEGRLQGGIDLPR
jgi:hypothetical protein